VITLRNVRVTGFSRSYYDIYWEVVPTTSDLQEYEFYVERSEAEAGPWHQIAGPLIDRYYVRDNNVPLISNNRTLFYRIKVRHPMSGRVLYSDIVDRWGREDLIAAEIIRLETLLYEEFAGVLCWLFPRRTFGQRCPQCYDEVLGKVIGDSCPTCYGTGFSGGYHYPIEFWAQVDESEHTENVATHGHEQQRLYTWRCPASPDVTPLSLFIDNKNRRFRVVSVGGTSKGGVRVRQEIRAVLLQPGSIEDAIPLKVDAERLQTVPWRNYTNPQDPFTTGATPDSALDRMLGRYGYKE
jgi:hypothetical protein